MIAEFEKDKLISSIQTTFGERLLKSNIPVFEHLSNTITVERYYTNHDLYARILSPETLMVFDGMMTMSIADYIVEQFEPMCKGKSYHRLPESAQQIIYMLAISCFTVSSVMVDRSGDDSKDRYYYVIPDSLVKHFNSEDLSDNNVIMWFDDYTKDKLIHVIRMYVDAIHMYTMDVSIRNYPRMAYIPTKITREALIYQMASVYMNDDHVYYDPRSNEQVPLSTMFNDIIDNVDDVIVDDKDLTNIFITAVEPAIRATIYNTVTQNGFGLDIHEVSKHVNNIETQVTPIVEDDDFDNYRLHVKLMESGTDNTITEYTIYYSDIIELVKKNSKMMVPLQPVSKHETEVGADLLKCVSELMVYIIGKSVDSYTEEFGIGNGCF